MGPDTKNMPRLKPLFLSLILISQATVKNTLQKYEPFKVPAKCDFFRLLLCVTTLSCNQSLGRGFLTRNKQVKVFIRPREASPYINEY